MCLAQSHTEMIQEFSERAYEVWNSDRNATTGVSCNNNNNLKKIQRPTF